MTLGTREIIFSLFEKHCKGAEMSDVVPKKDGSRKGKGQIGRGCGGNSSKRKGKQVSVACHPLVAQGGLLQCIRCSWKI